MSSNYRRLLAAYLLSAVGSWLCRLALPLMLFQETHSPLIMAGAYALTFVPSIIIMPFGGVIADRLKRQKILIYGDSIACGLTLFLAFTVTWFKQDIALIYLFVFLLASVTSVYFPAFQSFLPSLVHKDKLSKANSYILSIDNLMLLIGPLCSGLIISILGAVLSLYINAFTFLLSAFLIIGIRPANPENLVNKGRMTILSVLQDLKEAGRYAMNIPVIKYGCILFIFSNFGMQVFYANFMFYLANNLHLTPSQIGLTYALSGVGAVIGSLIAPYLKNHFSEGRLLLWCCLGESISTFLLLFVKNYVMVGLAWGGVLASLAVTMVTYFTLRQRLVPSEYIGRAVAVTRVISFCAIPIASVVGGVILRHNNNIQQLMWLGGTVLLISAVFGWFTPLNQTKQALTNLAKVKKMP